MLAVLLLLLLIVGFVIASLPMRISRVALQNCKRLDGTWSPKRTLKESQKLADLFGAVLLALVCAVTITGTALFMVNSYIIPIPIAFNIFSVFDVDVVQWEANIEEGDLGDVGAQYEQWSQEQGFSSESARFWQDFLWEYWPSLTLWALVLAGLFYWFMGKFYVTTLVRYSEHVLKRQKAYQAWDMRKALRLKHHA